jgi:hypothetical protein
MLEKLTLIVFRNCLVERPFEVRFCPAKMRDEVRLRDILTESLDIITDSNAQKS